jgi:hypothetical protein
LAVLRTTFEGDRVFRTLDDGELADRPNCDDPPIEVNDKGLIGSRLFSTPRDYGSRASEGDRVGSVAEPSEYEDSGEGYQSDLRQDVPLYRLGRSTLRGQSPEIKDRISIGREGTVGAKLLLLARWALPLPLLLRLPWPQLDACSAFLPC